MSPGNCCHTVHLVNLTCTVLRSRTEPICVYSRKKLKRNYKIILRSLYSQFKYKAILQILEQILFCEITTTVLVKRDLEAEFGPERDPHSEFAS